MKGISCVAAVVLTVMAFVFRDPAAAMVAVLAWACIGVLWLDYDKTGVE